MSDPGLPGPDALRIHPVVVMLMGPYNMSELTAGYVTVRNATTGETVYADDVTLEVSASGEFVLRFDVTL